MSDERRVKQVDAHFESGGASPRGRDWRAEVAADPAARRRFSRWLLLGRIDRQRPTAKERLARELGLAVTPRRTAPRWSFAAGALAAAAVALLLVVNRPVDDGFQARGGGAAVAAELRVFRISEGRSTPVGAADTVAANDELAFAYTNPAGRKWLMVFAVGPSGTVYWFQPAWTDATQNPGAVPAMASSDLVELPSATSHAWTDPSVVVHALLSDRRRTVQEVEAQVRAGGLVTGDADVVLRQPLRVSGRTR